MSANLSLPKKKNKNHKIKRRNTYINSEIKR